MDIYIDLKLDKMVAQISLPQGRNDNILAFGTLWFYSPSQEEPIIKVKGFTIRQQINKTTNAKFFKIVFPAYRAGQNFITSFIFQNDELLNKTREALIKAYYAQVGDNPFQNPEPELNVDDIPF